ncbi:FtsQ-type POTRA domain-containing protein [Treponema sp. HNW]|uniref:cell division protein FtsQ/DivIB n=1 Tax=Treponema sp. HNW TaxID=3116654 RepID=UPI003D13D60C
MSDPCMYSDFSPYYKGDTETIPAEAKKRGILKRNMLKTALFVLFAVCLLEGAIYFIIMPWTSAVEVSFTGLKSLKAEELGRGLSMHCGSRWLGFNTATAASVIASYGAVESVSVEKRFPNQVFVKVIERVPVALMFTQDEGKTRAVHIDKNGVLFNLNSTPAVSVPLLTGFDAEVAAEGMRIDTKYRELLKQIASIQQSNAAYFSLISEIKVVVKEYGNYELAVYPLHVHARVLTDAELSESTLQTMLLTLDVIYDLEPNVCEVDMRRGSTSYKVHS